MAPGAVTLADYATISNDPLVYNILATLLMNGNVLNDIPLVTKPSMVINGSRVQDNLPDVAWANLNENPTTVRSQATAFSEDVYIVRNAIDVDELLVMDENRIQDPRAFNLQVYLAALRYDINDKFINNNHTTGNLKAPVGLKDRLDNYATYGPLSEMKIDAGAVDLSPGGTTAATANTFLEYLDQMLSYMGEDAGNSVVFYMNDLMKRRFATILRKAGPGSGWRTDMDAFGREVTYYRNAKIVDIGRKADQSTRIITSTEAATGAAGASVHTSIYAVKYGVNSFAGWQMAPFSARDMGNISGTNILRLLISWTLGLFQTHPRAVSRLYGIKVA